MKPYTLLIVAILGLSVVPSARGQWPAGHFDYVPHTQTHFDYVPHNGHYHVVPHTTTHYDPVWHDTTGWNSGYSGYVGSGVVTYPSTPAVSPATTIVTSPIPAAGTANVIPAASRGTITLANPARNGGAVNYSVNTFTYSAQPGQTQTLNNDRPWTIAFDNGRGQQMKHRLDSGAYEFRVDAASGWSLVRIDGAGDAPPPPRAASTP